MTERPPRQSPPSTAAAGLTALKVTYEHARQQTGVIRALRVLTQANQKRGFDCPGCAWPDAHERSWFEFCENGAKAILDEATKQRATPSFFSERSISELNQLSDQELNQAGRLIEPLIKRADSDRYEQLSYQDVYEIIAAEMAQLEHVDQAAFYTSGRTSNEAAYLYQLMVRALGTNNLPDCSNLCHESSGVALKHTIGIGKGTVRLADFELADLIFVVGQNPGTNHPRMLSTLRAARLRGATIVSVNPLIEPGLVRFSHPQEPADLLSLGAEISDKFVRVQVGGDQALFRALNKRLLELERSCPGAIDRAFIAEHTTGIVELEAAAQAASYDELEKQSGIAFEEVDQLARLSIQSRATIVCWAMGLTQHENAVDTICEVSNFLLLRGNIGKPGAGACPVRGHSNVQGDRSMGIAPELSEEVRKATEQRYDLMIPKERGLDSVATIQAMFHQRVKVFMALGGNFLSACPDTEVTRTALSRCDLTVFISTKLNRSHLAPGRISIILPCLGRTERDITELGEQIVSVENSMGIVHASRGGSTPAHPQLRGEPRLIAELASVIFEKMSQKGHRWSAVQGLPWRDWAHNYELIRDEIAAVVPGFGNYNQRLRNESGFELENGPRDRNFTTSSAKARFTSAMVRRLEAKEGELILMTVRSHDQFNTTVYSNNDRYRGVSESRRVVLMNPVDLSKRNLKAGSKVRITSHFGQETRSVQDFYALAYDVPEGTAAAYFPEANPLVFLESYAATSRTPTSKSIRIVVEAQ